MEPMKCPLPLDRASFAPLGVGQLAQFCPSFRTSPMDSEKESIGGLFFSFFSLLMLRGNGIGKKSEMD